MTLKNRLIDVLKKGLFVIICGLLILWLDPLLRRLGVYMLDVDWGQVLNPIVQTIADAFSYSIPLWYLIFAVIAWLSLKRILKRVDFRAKRRVSLTVKRTPTSRSIAQVQSFDQGSPVSTKILEEGSGFIAVWAQVTNEHNRPQERSYNVYVLSTAGNNGEALGNKVLATYPNAWGILRVTPVERSPYGLWRFFCNGVKVDRTEINSVGPVSPGWRLFTVEWSKNENFIRFYIDKDLLGEKPYANWPQEVGGDFSLGKWVQDLEYHRFNSVVGPVSTRSSTLQPDELEVMLANKPSS